MDSEQIKIERAALYAMFPLDDHKIREGYTRGGHITWFVYVDSEAIQARLDELFFMEWELTYSDYPTIQDDFVAVAATLKIRGMARTGSGGQGLNGQNKINEDTVKGAYTDAFKRAAAKWGIAMYLTIAPKFETDTYTKGNWDMRDFREAQAWAQFVAWYQNTPYIAPVMNGKQPAAPPKQEQKLASPKSGNGTPQQNPLPATHVKAFPNQAAAVKWALSWQARGVSSNDIFNALRVDKLGDYEGTIEQATTAVEQLLADRVVEFEDI